MLCINILSCVCVYTFKFMHRYVFIGECVCVKHVHFGHFYRRCLCVCVCEVLYEQKVLVSVYQKALYHYRKASMCVCEMFCVNSNVRMNVCVCVCFNCTDHITISVCVCVFIYVPSRAHMDVCVCVVRLYGIVSRP